MINLLDDLPARTNDEEFTEVLAREGVRIERIVSTGQLRRPIDPTVRIMTNGCSSRGPAGLRIEGERERNLRAGAHLLISAHRSQWVTYTANGLLFGWRYTSLEFTSGVEAIADLALTLKYGRGWTQKRHQPPLLRNESAFSSRA